ncbi:hypothetical protein SEUCBS140593_010783 [Sporothrix eucalyptigena]|uniref:C6 zinc finger domain containing protein n=1 Tax=Sporothrix eucalyptigena TaxID=1812306 RepID=A0ABP0D3V3_9PEZI
MQHKAINLENNSSSGGSYDEGSELVRYPGAIWGQLGGWGDHNIKLDLEPKTVWMYVKSYEQNIQNMHPLICPEPLHAMANLFLATLPCASPSQAAFAGTFDLPKTSTGSTPIAPTMPLRPGMPFRNVESALVLSILALGKICLHKHARLPNVLPENLEQPESPPPGGWQRSRPSPAHGDFGISSSNSFVNNDEYSPAPSFQDSPLVSPMRRNLDEIPGLDYFTAACEIMASHPAGRELNYVWVHILASLYYGQLGRPIDSLESVARAGRLLLAMMLPSMSRYESIHDTLMEYSSKYEFGERVQVPESENVQHPDNPYLVAYWSCVQLESDILAELRFPPSGILPYEKHIPYPRLDLLVMHGIEQRVLESYMAQLYLRKQLNDIHKTLCHSDIDGAPNSKQIEIYSTILSPHSWAPVQYAFEDTDPPPDEILHARLRAKYWGAQVIVHMFYVRRILDHNFNQRAKREERRRKREENGHNGDESNDDKEYITMGKVDEDVARVLHPSIRNPHQVSRPAPRYPVDPNTPREQQFGPDKLLIDVDTGSFSPISITLARRGIQALIESTRAFHSLPDRRFIITDVFGTAHTQWGNLLILDSIQRDPVLGRYISGELVNDLFCKTIDFFEIVSQPSSALGYDLRILKGLYAMRMRESVCNGQAQDPGPP